MDRSLRFALAAAVLIALASLWMTEDAFRRARPGARALPRPSADRGSSGASVLSGAEILPSPAEPRRDTTAAAADAPPNAPGRVDPPAAPLHDRVRVLGRMSRAGLPVADYDLAFHALHAGLASDPEDWDVTDEDGRFEVELPVGGYAVIHADGGPWIRDVLVPGDEPELALDIDLPLRAIRGNVSPWPIGVPAQVATVYALRTPTPTAHATAQALTAMGGETRVRADGSFELIDLPRGEYALVVRHGELVAAATRVEALDDPVEPVQITLRLGHTLRGVVKGPDGAAVGMELWICAGARSMSAAELCMVPRLRCDSKGSFSIGSLAPGPYSVFGLGKSGDRHTALHADVVLRSDQPPVELAALACGSLSITVVRADGAPLAKARLDIRSHDGGFVPASLAWLDEESASGPDGRLELDDVIPGTYRIAALVDDRTGSYTRAVVRSGATTTLFLQLD